jgi:hypothetical protein
MRRIIMIAVLVIVVLLLVAQFGPSLVHGETVRPASPRFGASWFEARGLAALLTMRVWHCAACSDLILRSPP